VAPQYGTKNQQQNKINGKSGFQRRGSWQSNSSSFESNESEMGNMITVMDQGRTMTTYYKSLTSIERGLVKNIIILDSCIKQNILKIKAQQLKIDRLRDKYLTTFRSRNPDLRHLTVEQIKDYTDLLIKESQNLR